MINPNNYNQPLIFFTKGKGFWEKSIMNYTKFLKERITKASSTETKVAYIIVLEQYKKRILYTEEEIFSLGDRYEEYCINCFGNLPKSFSEWFNQNKKK